LFDLSGGKPRLVNLLCDRALAAGFNKSASVIDEELVNSAAEDLDMAPPPSGRMLGNPATIALLVLLMLAGAAAGALIYRAELAAIIARFY
jgi:general secretion pathway protein A